MAVCGAVALTAGVVGRRLSTSIPAPALVEIGPVRHPAPVPGPEHVFALDGLTPIVVANTDFYRIDTALVVPRVDLSRWTLRVAGMVDDPLTLRYDDLLAMDLVEDHVTIACVSNYVGGSLVGNARWTGVRLAEVLERAGLNPAPPRWWAARWTGSPWAFPPRWSLTDASR